nr:trehalase family glycosidase [Novosphingobium sp. Gsoil 351]
MTGAKPPQPPFALTVSAEARAVMTPMLTANPAPEMTASLMRNPVTRKAIRTAAALRLRPLNKGRAKRYGVDVAKARIAGVAVKLVRRRGLDAEAEQRLLINFHGGGFMVDSGSLTETIPIAGMTGIPVVSVMYRMAPEHPFPAAVDDALAVYRDALARRSPGSVGIYGTSAGAVLTLQLLARIRAEGLPMPAAAGFFSGSGDLALAGDCEAFLPSILADRSAPDTLADYSAGTERTNPLLSPIYGDLSGLPPMLVMTSTRDQLLSQTVLADLALRRAGVQTDLRVYEGMMHAFWAWIECPETDDAPSCASSLLCQATRRVTKTQATPQELYGPLLAAVQERDILADGKTFVDAVPKRSIGAIMADFRQLPNDDEALARFVSANFNLPPSTAGATVPSADPAVSLRDHIRAMWSDLARDPADGATYSSALPVRHRHVVPGGRFREIYYWDSYFTMLGLVRDGETELANGIVDAMTDLIEEHGHVPNGARTYFLGRSQPPLFHMMVALLDDRRPDVALRRLDAMKREYAWWMEGADDIGPGERCNHVARLADGSLVNRYWDPSGTPRDESWREDIATAAASDRPAREVYRDLRAGAESGWDFSSRWLDDSSLSSIRTTSIAPVDLNAFLFGLETAIAQSGDTDAPAYTRRAQDRQAAIQRHFWDGSRGFFADLDLHHDQRRPQPSAAALAPLWSDSPRKSKPMRSRNASAAISSPRGACGRRSSKPASSGIGPTAGPRCSGSRSPACAATAMARSPARSCGGG